MIQDEKSVWSAKHVLRSVVAWCGQEDCRQTAVEHAGGVNLQHKAGLLGETQTPASAAESLLPT